MVGVRFILTGACQSTQANISLLHISNRRSVRLLLWNLGKHLLNIRPYEYKLCIPGVMSFVLVSHLPRLDVFLCERKVSNVIFQLFFINNLVKQRKMLKKRPVVTG